MAWTAANPTSIGEATKKSHYDTLWDNAQYLKDSPDFATNISIQTKLFQNFLLQIYNDAGTIKHRIIGEYTNKTATDFSAKILNGTATLTATPTADDASTAMANGGKITSAGAKNIFILDTAIQVVADFAVMAVVEMNNLGAAGLGVIPQYTSRNVNGVTRVRLELNFYDFSGSAIDLSAIAASKEIVVRMMGFLA